MKIVDIPTASQGKIKLEITHESHSRLIRAREVAANIYKYLESGKAEFKLIPSLPEILDYLCKDIDVILHEIDKEELKNSLSSPYLKKIIYRSLVMTNVTYAYFKSKDEEQALFMTGSDIGLTKWDNELKEALLLAPITLRQYQIFDAIHRLTLGWNKKSDRITNTQLGKMTSIHHTHVCKVRKELEDMNMILKIRNEVAIIISGVSIKV